MTETRPKDAELARARQARLVAMVIAITALVWMGAQWAGGALGWQARFVFLFDFAAIAAFVWALVVTYRTWAQGRG
jgi:ABC-type transport system involved in cytochrome bd biosynthesis fused ATPase/permease subunit